MKSKRASKYDWAAIKNDYLQGFSWKEIETKYGISAAGLNQKVKKEDWKTQKADFQMKLAKKTLAKRTGVTVKTLKEFNLKAEQSCDVSIALVRNQIIRLSNEERKAKEDKKVYELDPDYLGKLSKIAEMVMNLKYRILGYNPPPGFGMGAHGDGHQLPDDIEGEYMELDVDASKGNETIELYNELQRKSEALEEEKIKLLQVENSSEPKKT